MSEVTQAAAASYQLEIEPWKQQGIEKPETPRRWLKSHCRPCSPWVSSWSMSALQIGTSNGCAAAGYPLHPL